MAFNSFLLLDESDEEFAVKHPPLTKRLMHNHTELTVIKSTLDKCYDMKSTL